MKKMKINPQVLKEYRKKCGNFLYHRRGNGNFDDVNTIKTRKE